MLIYLRNNHLTAAGIVRECGQNKAGREGKGKGQKKDIEKGGQGGWPVRGTWRKSRRRAEGEDFAGCGLDTSGEMVTFAGSYTERTDGA